MTSIFDLKQSAAELPMLNQGTAKLTYEQMPPTRDVTGSNFPNGSIHIRWEVSGTRWWIPSRTYIRMRGYLQGATVPAADPITYHAARCADDIAPNMGFMANLFQSAEFRIADKTVSRVSDFMPQVDALETRLNKSKSWLDSVGSTINFWQPEFAERLSVIASDGGTEPHVLRGSVSREELGYDAAGAMNRNSIAVARVNSATGPGSHTGTLTFSQTGGAALPFNAALYHRGDVLVYAGVSYTIDEIVSATVLRVSSHNEIVTVAADSNVEWELHFAYQDQYEAHRNAFECIWQPPLSIFKVSHALPSGKYELVLNPQNAGTFMEHVIESRRFNKVQTTDFRFVVSDMYLYVSTVEGPAVDSVNYFMSLDETRCQTEDVQSGTGLQQKNFDVSPSTYALTMAFQSRNAGSDTRFSASKFKVEAIAGVPGYPSGELALERFYISYAGMNKPSPDADPQYSAGEAIIALDYYTSRYIESNFYSGAFYDCGGAEDKKDWLERGAYYYFSWPRDGSSESTRVNINFKFGANLGDTARALLFDHHKKMVLISVVGGRVVDVIEQDG